MNLENEENINEQVSSPPSETKNEDAEKKPKRFVFNCTKCGKCCEKFDEIPVYIEDLQRWMKDSSLSYVIPFLQIVEKGPYNIQIVLAKPKTKEVTEDAVSKCPLYDSKNKLCNLYSSMPVHCQAYPLAFNGEKYFLTDSECPGLGNGTMTKESLTIARERARTYYDSEVGAATIMPIIYGLILTQMMMKSQEAMNSMSEEDKKQLDELLAKSKKSEDPSEFSGEETIDDEQVEE